MSQLVELETEEAFNQHVASLKPSTLLVLSFHTPWAAPCAQMKTVLSTLASTYPVTDPPAISFASVNAEELPDVSESYDVTAVPFLVIVRDGQTLDTVSGSDATKVRDTVEKYAGQSNASHKGITPPLQATPRDDASVKTNGTKDLSGYAPSSGDPATAPEMSSNSTSKEELNARLGNLVKAAPVMLFMKGTPSSPQCGFSRQLVGILRENGVKYGFFNILADDEVRQGLKEYSDWPTFPQLYVGGELVGGLDIVKEELAADPDFLKDYSVSKSNGGPAAPDAQPGSDKPIPNAPSNLDSQAQRTGPQADVVS